MISNNLIPCADDSEAKNANTLDIRPRITKIVTKNILTINNKRKIKIIIGDRKNLI